MEIIEKVTKSGIEIGKITREEAHAKKIRHALVHIILKNRKGEFLIQKRSEKKDLFPNYYELTLSGHVEANENAAIAALRELMEELKIKIPLKNLKLVGGFNLDSEEVSFITLFIAKVFKMPKIGPEVKWIKWLPLEEIKNLMRKEKFTPGSIKALEMFEKEILEY